MNITETIKQSLRYVAMAGVVMTAFSFASCSDDDDEKEYVEKHNEYLNFYADCSFEGTQKYPNDIQKIMDASYIADLLNRKDVDTVYFRSCGYEWENATAVSVIDFSRGLQKCAEQDPSRIRGTGEMNFKLGEASLVPTDSTWLANFGFSINKNVK